MRAILQRVKRASVTVEDKLTGEIGAGVLVLIGIHKDDQPADAEYIVRKIMNVRLWGNDEGKMWKKSVVQMGYEILCVSQFTLWGGVKQRSQPDFSKAMSGSSAEPMYRKILEQLGKQYDASKIKDGEFGAMMDVSLVNDGPVTLQIDSRNFTYDDLLVESTPKGSPKPSGSPKPIEL
eukprot:CFRG2767T1